MRSDVKYILVAALILVPLGGVGLYLHHPNLGSRPGARAEAMAGRDPSSEDSSPESMSLESDEFRKAFREGQKRALQLQAQSGNSDKAAVASLEDLPLPDGTDDSNGRGFMAAFIMEARLVNHKQDQIYRERAPYEENAEQMKASILAQFAGPISKADVPKLRALSRDHMREYWARDGLSGSHAYLECYLAQAAAELALQVDADNPVLYEDLAEIIQAAHPLYSVSINKNEKPANNTAIIKQLIGVREKQLALYEKADAAWPPAQRGISPVFKCFMELVNLHVLDGNTQGAAAIYAQAAAAAPRGGWADMADELKSYALTVESTPRRPMPASVVQLALNARYSREELASAREGVTPESAFQSGRHWIRQTMFFEGPTYLDDQ